MANAIAKQLPKYNYVYLGDTARVPYGDRTEKQIYTFFEEAVKYLFEKKNCMLVIVACNTVSTASLRKLQQGYLKKNYPDRRVLGMVDPTLEEIMDKQLKRIGVIATTATIKTNKYKTKLQKLNRKINVYQEKTPEFVPLIEAGRMEEVRPLLKKYLDKFTQKDIDALVLACTHYPILKKEIRAQLPKHIQIISQDEFVPAKLKDYLNRHQEIEKKIARTSKRELLVTKMTPTIKKLSGKWFGKSVEEVVLGK